MEDGCQVLDRYPADKYSISTEQVAAALCSVATAPAVAARTLLQQLVFAYLTCNGDAHAKNFAVLQSISSDWEITPAFDLPTSYLYGDTTLALSIANRRREDVTRPIFMAFARGLGLNDRVTNRVIDHLCERIDDWLPEIDALPFDTGRLQKLRRAIQYRRRQLSA